ncbi:MULTISPECIES: carbon starvation protein A [Aerococcus]|uniref:Carbon starvation protein A n=1 Tax=Aerococcus sanguinicola TaxID=119206 RepID=A0A5N1GNY0_9LACT|nr:MULTISPECIES: carbon starvation CstA family protein [Aerococcus]KAA9301969.1 carbon starvation protein A [Aerococcus sanguinicola]MDK6368606.1 carbon starvation CstA family protein [Aerococcus sp. UMB9870]MDK6679689.1 carbon starvation CstA family protein [Aerococcus sp. UMB8608]MDK6686039.1 carbon starvation CstA family protein [Aerococcus sp. UMB8623]MDK6940845.1 carbon starvation CstA family protein [Aerococcus sp. UMB8487]
MFTFLAGIVLLLVGYFVYGRFVERNFQIEPNRTTPAEALRDNLDFVPMSKQKNAIIELLNIAGTGPIFGPIMGALYGPVAYIWIVVGCIFAGAVHDYMIGMISLRNNGAHLPELTGRYLGNVVKHVVNIFAMLLLLLVGTVFVMSPASLIKLILPAGVPLMGIVIAIFIYYLISTILPIDKALGKVYPWFGAILIISTAAIGLRLIMVDHASMPELSLATLQNFHPDKLAIFPGMFFTISCGALSGFHATQAPMVSRTMTNEREGRYTFYGMMIAEGVIAMIWLAASMALFDGQTLSEMIASGTPSVVVNKVSYLLLGNIFGTLAIMGVIVLPLSSGLSAFRSLRAILADYLNIKQDTLKKILAVTLPLYAISFVLTFVDFQVLWRYFNWANQVTAVISLLVSTRYLYLKSRNYLITLIPSLFMLLAVVVYILSEPIGFRMSLSTTTYIVGAIITAVIFALYWISGKRQKAYLSPDDPLLNDQKPIRVPAGKQEV